MAKTKKLLLTALSVALVAIIAVFGTIAYLQDTDSDVNVMTLGEVDIVQHEYQRVLNENGTYKIGAIDDQESYVLEAFEQAKPLYPIVGDPSLSGTGYAGWDATTVRMSQVDSYGSMQVFAGKNAQDKFVTVENTGKSDAYVRTLVALEVGSGNSDLIGTSYHKTWTKNSTDTIEIDGNNYYLIEYVYAGAKNDDDTFLRHENGILPAGDTTYPSLSQVYLKSAATNEDMKALDGNNNGTFDILVLSQAVQTEGFANAKTALDTAFGTPEEKAAEWFGGEKFTIPTAVATADELSSALADGKNVYLTEDITVDADETITVVAGKKAELNLNGHTITAVSDQTGKNANLIDVRGELTVSNGTIKYNHSGTNMGWNSSTNVFNVTAGGVLNIENATIENTGGSDMAFCVHLNNWGEVTLNVENSTLKSSYIAVRVFNSGNDMNNVTIKNTTLNGKYCFWVHNYTVADFGTQEKADAHKALLNFDIFNNANTFTSTGKAPVLYGFTDSIYFDGSGNEIEIQ